MVGRVSQFTLHIGPVAYNVTGERHLTTDDGGKAAGWVKHDDELIRIDAVLPKRSQHVTVLHELVHVILQQAGQHEWYGEEGLLDCLAYGLVGAKVETEGGDCRPLLESLFVAMDEGA